MLGLENSENQDALVIREGRTRIDQQTNFSSHLLYSNLHAPPLGSGKSGLVRSSQPHTRERNQKRNAETPVIETTSSQDEYLDFQPGGDFVRISRGYLQPRFLGICTQPFRRHLKSNEETQINLAQFEAKILEFSGPAVRLNLWSFVLHFNFGCAALAAARHGCQVPICAGEITNNNRG